MLIDRELERARVRRYRATAKGQAAHQRATRRWNARIVRIGQRYICQADTAEEARAINAHTKERLNEFTRRQRLETCYD